MATTVPQHLTIPVADFAWIHFKKGFYVLLLSDALVTTNTTLKRQCTKLVLLLQMGRNRERSYYCPFTVAAVALHTTFIDELSFAEEGVNSGGESAQPKVVTALLGLCLELLRGFVLQCLFPPPPPLPFLKSFDLWLCYNSADCS